MIHSSDDAINLLTKKDLLYDERIVTIDLGKGSTIFKTPDIILGYLFKLDHFILTGTGKRDLSLSEIREIWNDYLLERITKLDNIDKLHNKI